MNFRFKLTSVSACVSFQVKRVVESFTTERAQISLDVRVTLNVTV